MVANANQNDMPVIDASDVMTAIHQNHEYQHLAGGRFAAYVTGQEARENYRQGGGSHLVKGAQATMKLERHEETQAFSLAPVKRGRFWRDLPRFSKMVTRMLGGV